MTLSDENRWTTESKKQRYLFLDNIKVLFAILIIFWHVMVTYVDIGWWYYKESNPTGPVSYVFLLLIASIGGIFQTSLLGLFFLLGGYFTPKSYDRKGGYRFWKERLLRLGVPLFLYILFVNPVMIYILSSLGVEPWSANPVLQGSILNYYNNGFQSWSKFIDFISFGGPMWFLRVLLILTAVYTIWRQMTKVDSLKRRIPQELPIPRYLFLLLLAVVLGCLTFLVRIVLPIDDRPLEIPWGQLIQYLMMFGVGIISVRYRWFEKMTRRQVKIWLVTVFICVIAIYLDYFLVLGIDADLAIFSGGANVHALLFALVDNIVCMGVIFILIKVFYAKFNKQGPLLRNLSTSAYHMYLVHPPILVAISLSIAFIEFDPILKIGLVFPLGVFICYLVSHYVTGKIHLK
ncbi:MAG: hypothetical protein EAX87_09390 [Candidatus Thorarchaeota archaeon]|nr:hypothetical protein [Candidatus Thorarchaeota archaeon]